MKKLNELDRLLLQAEAETAGMKTFGSNSAKAQLEAELRQLYRLDEIRMTVDRFWAIIEKVRNSTRGFEHFAEVLTDELAKLPDLDILWRHKIYDEYQRFAYTGTMISVCEIIRDWACEDSCENIFRQLLAQGRGALMAAMSNPDSIAALDAIRHNSFFDYPMEYIVTSAYNKKHGLNEDDRRFSDMYEDFVGFDMCYYEASLRADLAAIDSEMRNMIDFLCINNDAQKKLLPRLYAKFRWAEGFQPFTLASLLSRPETITPQTLEKDLEATVSEYDDLAYRHNLAPIGMPDTSIMTRQQLYDFRNNVFEKIYRISYITSETPIHMQKHLLSQVDAYVDAQEKATADIRETLKQIVVQHLGDSFVLSVHGHVLSSRENDVVYGSHYFVHGYIGEPDSSRYVKVSILAKTLQPFKFEVQDYIGWDYEFTLDKAPDNPQA